MRKLLSLGLALGMILSSAAVLVQPADAKRGQRVNKRQRYQQKRIHQGVRSGQLNRREYGRLQKQQANLARAERRMRKSGDGLTGKERLRLEKMQDRASANIYRQKNDNQVRGGGKPDPRPNWKKRSNKRQVKQQKRLHSGLKDGSLTGKEFYRLQKQQSNLARKERHLRQDGLTKKEAYKLEKMQDRASGNIYKQKHDDQVR